MLLCYQRTRWTRFVHLGVLHQTIGVKKKMVSSMMPPRASESSNVFQFDALPATPAERSAPYLTSRAQLSEVAIRIVEMPRILRQRLELIIRQFGHKGELEALGDMLVKQQRLRTHMELPRILPSQLSPTLHGLDDYERLSDQMAFQRAKAELQGFPGSERQPITLPFETKKIDAADTVLDATPEATKAKAQQSSREARTAQLAIDTAEHEKTKYYLKEKVPFFPSAAIAFVAETLPARVAVYTRVLSEIKKRCPLFTPTRVLEYGAKGSPAVAVVQSLYTTLSDDKAKPQSAVIIEPSKTMRDLEQFLLSADSPWTLSWRESYNPLIEAQFTHETRYDIIAVTYALEDLPTMASRTSLIQGLWNQLDLNGFLIIVEPGTPTGYRWIHDIRELFITKLGTQKFHFFAPCPHEKACPLGASPREWCRFSQKYYKLPKYIYTSGTPKRDYAETTFSYLVIRKFPGPRSRFATENEAVELEDASYFWSRVISPPCYRPRECTLQVCSHHGHCERLVTRSAHPKELGHKAARQACWGDLWPYHSKVSKLHPQEEASPALLTYRRQNALKHLRSHREMLQKLPEKLNEQWKADIATSFAHS